VFGIDNPWGLPVAGLIIGGVMGFVARRNHFCTMSALERHWYAGDSSGLRAWVLAAAVALVGTQLLVVSGAADLSESFYLTEPLSLAGAVIGGMMFGFGMALVGSCGFGALVRLGGGSLRALIVLSVLGVSALAMQRGVLGHVRQAVFDPIAIDLGPWGGQSLADLLSRAIGFDTRIIVASLVAAVMLFWVFRDSGFRKRRGMMFAGLVIGLGIVAGWYVTFSFSQTLFVPVQIEAGSFVAPVGDAILQLITVTGALPDYGVGLIAGILIGAAFAAWQQDDVRWEACDDAGELSRHLIGAFLMGTGGILALGCTIGQGVSALSLMAVSAPVAVASMVLGARMGLGYIVEGSVFGFVVGMRHGPAE